MNVGKRKDFPKGTMLHYATINRIGQIGMIFVKVRFHPLDTSIERHALETRKVCQAIVINTDVRWRKAFLVCGL